MKQNRYTYALLTLMAGGLLICPEIFARPKWIDKISAYFWGKSQQIQRAATSHTAPEQRAKPIKQYNDFTEKDYIAKQMELPASLQGWPILHFDSLGQQSGSTCGHYTLSNAAAVQQLYFEHKALNDINLQAYARINLATLLGVLSIPNLDIQLKEFTNAIPDTDENHALIIMGSKIRDAIRKRYNKSVPTYEYVDDPSFSTSYKVIIKNCMNQLNRNKKLQENINSQIHIAFNVLKQAELLKLVEENEPLLQSIKKDLTEMQKMNKIDLPNQTRTNIVSGTSIVALKNLFFISSKEDHSIKFNGSGLLVDQELQDVQAELSTLYKNTKRPSKNEFIKFGLEQMLTPILNKMREGSYENIIHFACLLGHEESGHWVYIGIIKRKNKAPFIVHMNSVRAPIANQPHLVNILSYLANGLGLKRDATIHTPQKTDSPQLDEDAAFKRALKLSQESYDEEVARRLQEQYDAELEQEQTKKGGKPAFERTKQEIEVARRKQEQQNAERARKAQEESDHAFALRLQQEESDYAFAKRLQQEEDDEALARKLEKEEKEKQSNRSSHPRTRHKR